MQQRYVSKELAHFVGRSLACEEEQYSLWFAWKEIPSGWKQVGPKYKNKEECLAYIEKTWTDMRPKSLRDQMEKI